MRPVRTPAAFALMAVLVGAMISFSRAAQGAEPTTADCLTAYEDAVGLIRNHQFRATKAKLLICSSGSCPAEIQSECLRRLPEVETSLPTIVFEAKDGVGTNLFAVKVKMDGDLLAERLQGTALAIDPGEHVFTFEVAGRPIVEKHLLILEGEKLRRERVEFEALAPPKPAPSPAPAPIAKVDLLEQQPQPSSPPTHGLGRGRTIALILGGVGVAATGVGIAYGLITMSRKDHANNLCPTQQCDAQSGVDAWVSAHDAGNIATGAFIIGAAGIASGAATWFLAKPKADGGAGTHVSLGPGGVQVQGRW